VQGPMERAGRGTRQDLQDGGKFILKVLSGFPGFAPSPGQSGVGGEMASFETEASPPSRRRPPQTPLVWVPQLDRSDWTNCTELQYFLEYLARILGRLAGPLKQPAASRSTF